ncbi:MAG: 5-formyltetrahydrofolate cyclo-ligase [Pseudomonadota bacterium]
MSLAATKKSLRQYYRQLRNQLSIKQKKSAAQSVAHLFLKNILPHKKNRGFLKLVLSSLRVLEAIYLHFIFSDGLPRSTRNDVPCGTFRKSFNIAVYLAHDGEIDLQYLIEKLWQTECAVFLPVVHADTQQLCFVRYRASTTMKKNQYGIQEPENMTEFILPEALDIVLMPLVAFDHNGARLGMGKGYYDKSFAFCRYPHIKPMLVGVAYQCQYCEMLPVDEWDVPLDGIMTEKKLILLNENL